MKKIILSLLVMLLASVGASAQQSCRIRGTNGTASATYINREYSTNARAGWSDCTVSFVLSNSAEKKINVSWEVRYEERVVDRNDVSVMREGEVHVTTKKFAVDDAKKNAITVHIVGADCEE